MVTRNITRVLHTREQKSNVREMLFPLELLFSFMSSFVLLYCVLLEGLKTWGKEVSGLSHHQSHCSPWDVPRPLWSLAVCSHECLLQVSQVQVLPGLHAWSTDPCSTVLRAPCELVKPLRGCL